MAELHEALKQLSPVEWDSVPRDNLSSYLSECFTAAELICNSVPSPPNGTPYDSVKPYFDTPNAASSAKDIYASPARAAAPHSDHESLQKSWGKPMKFSPKDNPLNIALYKMAGHDRHGAWFARHQVIEGLGFSKFRKAMRREFPETLLTTGGPGAGAKRGLSAERRVERIDVDGVGRLEVYQLSAQMPSPVSPRDFLTLLLTTDQGLSDKSADGTYEARHFMVVSRPLDHPDVPQRANFVRGQYESVELIREIPLQANSSVDSEADPELNPVEWIMITRSDPGGGIPRFLVDRGTPEAMLSDVKKFLDWVCGQNEVPDQDADLKLQLQRSKEATENIRRESSVGLDGPSEETTKETSGNKSEDRAPDPVTTAPPADVENDVSAATQTQEGGIVSNLTSTLESGVQTYAPTPVSNFVHNQLHPEEDTPDDLSDSSSSTDSFMSAQEMEKLSTAPEYQARESTENVSVTSATSSLQVSGADKKNLSQHDKEILKIMQQREKLDQKLAKKRQDEEAKFKQSQEKDESEQGKARERMEKEMKKREERHRKEIEKLEAKRDKESRRAEEKRKKRDEQNKLSLVARERDELRSQCDLYRRENSLLSDQVETLQRENTALARHLGKVGGPDALKAVQDEVRSKAGSIKSDASQASLQSGTSSEKKESKDVAS